jgi:hypothetical protein
MEVDAMIEAPPSPAARDQITDETTRNLLETKNQTDRKPRVKASIRGGKSWNRLTRAVHLGKKVLVRLQYVAEWPPDAKRPRCERGGWRCSVRMYGERRHVSRAGASDVVGAGSNLRDGTWARWLHRFVVSSYVHAKAQVIHESAAFVESKLRQKRRRAAAAGESRE